MPCFNAHAASWRGHVCDACRRVSALLSPGLCCHLCPEDVAFLSSPMNPSALVEGVKQVKCFSIVALVELIVFVSSSLPVSSPREERLPFPSLFVVAVAASRVVERSHLPHAVILRYEVTKESCMVVVGRDESAPMLRLAADVLCPFVGVCRCRNASFGPPLPSWLRLRLASLMFLQTRVPTRWSTRWPTTRAPIFPFVFESSPLLGVSRLVGNRESDVWVVSSHLSFLNFREDC